MWNNVFRRDFNGGIALLNEPGAATVTLPLPSPMKNLAGETVTEVTLAASRGAVLQYIATSSTGSGQVRFSMCLVSPNQLLLLLTDT
jgi:hypothetical protein